MEEGLFLDYAYLKKLFQDLFEKCGFKFDCKYDWTKPEKENVVEI